MKIIPPETVRREAAARAAAAAQRPLPKTCTKYELVNAAKALGLYETLYAAYVSSAEMQFYWNTVQELDRDNADFQAFAQTLGIAEAQLDAVFRKVAENRA